MNEIKDIEKIAELKYPYNERNQFGELMTAPVGQNPPNYKKYERLRNAFIEGAKYAASQFTPVIGESGEEEKETEMLDFAMYLRGKVLEGHITNGQLLFWTKEYITRKSQQH